MSAPIDSNSHSPELVDVLGMLLIDAAPAGGFGEPVAIASDALGLADGAAVAAADGGTDAGAADATGALAVPFTVARRSDASTRSASSSATSASTKNARANGVAGNRARQFGQKLETAATRSPQAAQLTR